MKVLIVGCGNMGGAMLAGWLAGGLPASAFTVVDPVLAAAPDGVALFREIPAEEQQFDAILLGFKPQQLAEGSAPIARVAGSQTTVLSILAGVDLATLRRRFPAAGRIVRVMPNLAAAMTGQGARRCLTASSRRLGQPNGLPMRASWIW